MLFLFVVTIVLVLIVYLLIRAIRRPKNFPPGPFWLPIVGNLHQLKKLSLALGGQHLALSKLSQKYKSNVIGLKLGGEYLVVVLSYPLVKTVLTSEEYDGRPDNFFIKLRSLEGTRKGIVGTDGELWRIQRHFVTVHLRYLGFGKKTMEKQIQEEALEILEILKKNENKEVHIGQILPQSVLNVLWMLISGLRFNRNDDRLVKLLNLMDIRSKAFDMAGGTLNQLPWLRFVAPERSGYNLIRKFNGELKALLMEPIEEHFKTWTEGRDDDLIYSFITEMRKGSDEKTTFTEEQLVMVCLDIFLAGAQTTSNTLDFAFLMMLLYPDVKNKVQACLDDKFRKDEQITYSKRKRVPTIEQLREFGALLRLTETENCVHEHSVTIKIHIKRVPYVEAVLYEVQRFHTVTPIIGPRRVLKETTLDGYNIPKDSTVLISLYSVHHDEQYWKDSEIFRPERFLDEEGKCILQERLIQFGLGKRRCLGEILARSCTFTFFSGIMRNFQIELPPNAAKPTGIASPGITISPEKYSSVFIER